MFGILKKEEQEPQHQVKKIKLRGCISTAVLVFGSLLFAFYAILIICGFYENEYDWLNLAVATVFFVLFLVSLHPLLPRKYAQIITLIICAVWCLVILISATIGFVNRERSVEYNLLGEWIAENEKIKSKVVFKGDKDELEGTWSVYDYVEGKKSVIDFEVEDIDNFTMEIVTEDGDIRFIPFAVSKDTLFFDNIEHKNPDKNVKIPKGTVTYIKNDVIRPVENGLFIGMTKDEVENVISPTELMEKAYSEHVHCYYYEIPNTDVSCHLDFDDGILKDIKLHVDDKDSLNDVVGILSDLYGDYEKSHNTIYENCYDYEWESGNLIITLFENEERYWIWYRLDNPYRGYKE